MAKKKDTIAPPKRESDPSVWLIFGDDEYSVSHTARQIVDSLVPEPDRALMLEVIDGRAETADEAVAALRQARSGLDIGGLFGGGRVVWLRNVSFLQENKVGRLAAVKAEVAELVSLIKAGLMPGHRLVISAPAVDKRSAFFKACQTLADVREFSIPEKARDQEAYIEDRLREMAGRAGIELSATAIAGLYGKIGPDTLRLAIEIEKLRCYKGEGAKVTEEDVRRLASASRESAAWDLADAMGDRNLDRAVDTLRQLLFQGEEEFLLIMGLQARVRELLVFRACLDQGWIEVSGNEPWLRATWRESGASEQIMADLPEKLHPAGMNPFRAGRLAAQARKYTRSELVRAQRILLEAHEAMIRAPTPPDLLLELALVKIVGK